MTSIGLDAAKLRADRLFQRKRLVAFGIPAGIIAYLVYIFFAFNLPGLAQRANMDHAVTLIPASWSHNVHVTRDQRPRACS